MKSKILVLHIMLANNLQAMERSELQSIVYDVPANPQRILYDISEQQLCSIKPEEELSDSGIITALVVRPVKNKRQLVDSVLVSRQSVEGDKHSKEDESDWPCKELDAVTLMRSDVSSALGGAHLPGDNIHVDGMRMGLAYLKSGDIIVITDQVTGDKKVVLLKTDVPHYACSSFIWRFGYTAFEFINAEGKYERGFSIQRSDRSTALIHGLENRLRGVRLLVLKQGVIRKGDGASIVRGSEKNSLLHALGLENESNQWVAKSQMVAQTAENAEKAKRALRQTIRNKKVNK